MVSCDAQTLWSHLTALNNQQRLSRWIQSSEDRDAPCWPAITPQLVRAHTACCDHTREQLLNLLARYTKHHSTHHSTTAVLTLVLLQY